jgi:CubicO group peptidase (beta-lactamase class C family)
MSKLATSIVLAAALTAPLAADAPAPSTPAERHAAVDAVFAAYDRTDSPGCAVGVYRDGRMEYARGYGMANLELHVANSPSTVFDIGSTAKQFAAFSILLLAKDGKLSLDDPVRKFVPEVPDYGTPVTLRHLLTHTSGLRDYLGLMDLAGIRDEDLTTEEDALEIISKQKALNFPPGSEHLYSNSGYFLLSVVVKRASGKSIRDFAQERIFGPLGMTHTQYNDDHGRIIANRATGYAPRERGGFEISMSDFEQNGDGGIQTTVEDLLLWDHNFYEPAVGDRALLETMQTPARLNDGKALSYALGLYVGKARGLKVVNHGGAWVGYRAQLERFPEQRFSVACLCNLSTSSPGALARRVAAIYLGGVMEPEPAAKASDKRTPGPAASAAELARIAGAYRDAKEGTVWIFSAEGGALAADVGGEMARFDPVAPGRFALRGRGELEIRVVPGGTGRPRLEAIEPDEEPAVLEPIATWAPSADELAAYAGTYTAAEVPGAVFRFEVADGRLLLRHRTISAEPWRAIERDVLALGYRTARFTRDAAGKVDGFRLDAGRVRGIAFRKAAG